MAKKNNFRLTQKTARELIKKEFGFCGKLTVERAGNGVYIYKMDMGRFEVTLSNDWYEKNGLIDMHVIHDGGGSIWMYFEPDTLQEEYEAEEKRRDEIKEEQCDGCAFREKAKS
jgi:hypothetical protein